jgi:hypothetical protein
VLCEINVSRVAPTPDTANQAIVARLLEVQTSAT